MSRTQVGHGDFMSLVLKRIVAGFGHSVEKEKVPHRSAFVHNNTGITELEYFGERDFPGLCCIYYTLWSTSSFIDAQGMEDS